ncbi:MAG: pyruvate formate lyase-activating protein [Clostridia bacterium]|nr:pyruvate formate lyase-activating protein [Clostridia bacterium]
MELFCNLHSIETLGTVDGPGIRFIIFLQGCPLKCQYCHNRDTWEKNSGKKTSMDSLIKKILKSKPYMDASNGGVTVSGGEPLIQANFVTELFKKLHSLGINTCLDTAGSLPITQDIEKLLNNTDLVLLDIKHIDNKKCKELTGMPNTNTINFAKYLNSKNIPMWIRQVIIPTITDDKNDLIKLKEFLSTLNNIEKIEFLPYHDLGKHKWIDLGLKYPLEGIRTATEEDIKNAEKILGL